MKELITAPVENEYYPCEGCCFDYNGECIASERQTIDCNELNIIYKKEDDEKR